ncbi:hypothetical protein FVEN_g279 [Fusarium venenatum]|uniref:Uncharacterized protein n=1 Tax=Fusarium venenatum TaxID=56646 RepID=A0A2L2SYP5_9HYPO|nr:uncharacterized protein FVRRES_07618 [Fusarium venenatum]KAG8361987.1 hypothetical protein FVEN_g279 [Fusarium venenatum]KAH6994517.1 hypothetical protein EDB82DRAFT_197167 [Fusarium venenatum]CEI63182.1 unnamed protein product [Fusarium venenatum]
MLTSSGHTYLDAFSGVGTSGQVVQPPNDASYLSRGYSHFPYQGHTEGNNSDYSIDQQNHEGQPTNGVDLRQRYACPLHKLNPSKYQSCEHYQLTNWYHTYQHLNRVHSLGTDIKRLTYCPNCRVLFKGKTAKMEFHLHVRAGDCQTASIMETGMLLPEEYMKLARLGGGMSNEERWYAAWKKLFPSLMIPSSAYFESHVDILRRLAYDRARPFVGNADPKVIHSLIGVLFAPPVIPCKAPTPGFAQSENCFTAQSSTSPLFPDSITYYAPSFAQEPAMTGSLELSMQPMLESPPFQALGIPDPDNLHFGHGDVFLNTFGLQPDGDVPLHAEQGSGS